MNIPRSFSVLPEKIRAQQEPQILQKITRITKVRNSRHFRKIRGSRFPSGDFIRDSFQLCEFSQYS